MGLSGKQKKYIRKNSKKEAVGQIAAHLGITVQEIEDFLGKRWKK